MDILTKSATKAGVFGTLRNLVSGNKPNPIKNVMNDPESYKLEVYLDGDEIVMKLKPRIRTVTTVKTVPSSANQGGSR